MGALGNWLKRITDLTTHQCNVILPTLVLAQLCSGPGLDRGNIVIRSIYTELETSADMAPGGTSRRMKK